jgi:hypothetical protein
MCGMADPYTSPPPADAALLRSAAEDYAIGLVCTDLDRGNGACADCVSTAARLRALADMLEQSRNGHITCMCDACYRARWRER